MLPHPHGVPHLHVNRPLHMGFQSTGDSTWSIALRTSTTDSFLISLYVSWEVELFISVKLHRIQCMRRMRIVGNKNALDIVLSLACLEIR